MEDRRKTEFFPDDLVFAKMKSYPPWPAVGGSTNPMMANVCTVLGPDENLSSVSQNQKITVQFLGTNELGYLRKQDLFDYAEFREKFSIPKRIKGFCDGLKQISALYEEMCPEQQEGSSMPAWTAVNSSGTSGLASPDFGISDDSPLVCLVKKTCADENPAHSPEIEPKSLNDKPEFAKDWKDWLLQTKMELASDRGQCSVALEPLQTPMSPPSPVFEGHSIPQGSAQKKRRKISTEVHPIDTLPPSNLPILSEKRIPKKKKFDDDYIVDIKRKKKRKTLDANSAQPQNRREGGNVAEASEFFDSGEPVLRSSVDESIVGDESIAAASDLCGEIRNQMECVGEYEGAADICEETDVEQVLSDSTDNVAKSVKAAPLKIKFRKMDKRKMDKDPDELGTYKISVKKKPSLAFLLAKPVATKNQQNKKIDQIGAEEDSNQKVEKAVDLGKIKEELQLRPKIKTSKSVKSLRQNAALDRPLNKLRVKYEKKSRKVFVTAYGLWCEKQSESLAIERPEINTSKQINVILREMWRQVPEDEKKRLQVRAKKERQKRLQAVNINSSPVKDDLAEEAVSGQSGGEDFSDLSGTDTAPLSHCRKAAKKPFLAVKQPSTNNKKTALLRTALGRSRTKKTAQDAADRHTLVLARREPVGPVESRCRWWMYQSQSTTSQQRRSARENSPPRPLYHTNSVDSAAVLRLMAKSFLHMAERLEKTNEVTSSSSESVMVDSLMDGFFVSMVHLLSLLKFSPHLKNCYPGDTVNMLLEKTAFLTPL